MLDALNAIFLQSDFDPMGGMKFIHLEDFLGLIIRLFKKNSQKEV